MPGYAFHLEVLKQVATEVRRNEDNADGGLLNSPFARLGAFGPDLLQYAPPIDTLAAGLADESILTLVGEDIGSLNAANLRTLEDLFQKPIGSAYSALFSNVVIPLWPDLVTVIEYVQQAATIAQTQDTSNLSSFFNELPGVQTALTNLGTNTTAKLKSLLSIATLIAGGPWMEVAPAAAALLLLLPRADPQACRTYEFLRWHRSGQFAAALWANAQTDNQKAYALGWMTHVAASVTGEPFVTNIAGGPYRTHWWRNRLVQNFVDAWTFGFYEPSPVPGQGFPDMNGGDDPTPAYPDWAPLYGANLQSQFDVGALSLQVTDGIPDAVTAMAQGQSTTSSPNLLTTLAARFPAELTDQITAALEQTYPAGSQPAPTPRLTADAFAESYVGAYGVFWFLTSGDGPLGNNIVGAPPTASCGANPPSWTSSTSTPAPQSGSVVTTSGSAVCDAILAILALLSFLTGNVAAGIGLTVAAIEDVPSASINWPEVQCDVYWVETFVDKILNALRDALWMLTLAYPPPVMLGGPDPEGNVVPVTDFTFASAGTSSTSLPDNAPPADGVPLTKTNALSAARDVVVARNPGQYPHELDTGSDGNGVPDLDFFRYPVEVAQETDTDGHSAADLIPAGIYPSTVVNGMGITGDGIMQSGTPFPTAGTLFGDAVSNALPVIRAKAVGLPDYNLDGDRGYGWLGWRPKPLTDPSTPPLKLESD